MSLWSWMIPSMKDLPPQRVELEAPRSRPSARSLLVESLNDQIAYLRKQLHEQQQAHELREAEIRAQLVALANSNALAMSAYYGPHRENGAAASGVRRLVPPGGFTSPPPPASDEPPASWPFDNHIFGGDHVDLGEAFNLPPLAGATTAPGTDAEALLEEATIEAAAKEREAARLRSNAPARTGPEED